MAASLKLCTAVHYLNNASLDEIKRYLRDQPAGTAHPWSAGGSRLLLIATPESGIAEVDIAGIEAATFLNQARVAELEGMMAGLLDRFPQLEGIKSFGFQVLNPGDRVEVPLTAEITVAVLTDKKDGNYFDAVAYFRERDGIETLTYAARKYKGIEHSGDVGALLHFMKGFNSANIKGIPMTFGAVGYRRRALRTFVDQQPSVLLIDHTAEIIYIVPCPLDSASVGDATLVHLVAARAGDKMLICDVLLRPVTVDDVDTGNVSATTVASVDRVIEVANALEAAIKTGQKDDARPASGSAAAASAAAAAAQAEPKPKSEVETSKGQALDYAATVFIQNGLTEQETFDHGIQKVQVVYFGQGFTPEPSKVVTVLPHAFGRVEGGMAPALCNVPQILPVNTHIAIVYCGRLLEANARMVRVMGNAIFFIEADIALSDNVEATLNQVDVSATCMAGPNSIVVIRFGSRLFWYRGVRIPGLVDVVPCYADEVTDLLSAAVLNSWLATSPVLPWPRIQEVRDHRVFFEGRIMEIPDALAMISRIDLDGLTEATPGILDFLTQVSVLLESLDIKNFVAKVDARLSAMVEEKMMPLKDAVIEAYSTGDMHGIKEAVAKMKGARTCFSKVLRIISNALDNLDSVRGVSKKTQSIARRQRATKIGANVDRVKSMTTEEKLGVLEQYCESMLILSLEPSNLSACLVAVGSEKFRPTIRANANRLSFVQDGRMPFLDPNTFSCLLELTAEGAEHDLAGPQNMAIPQGHSGVARRLPAIAFPLLTEAVELRDPALINWTEKTNEECYAFYRIMLRSVFAEATTSRTLNITNSSDELGFFLMHLLLCSMESVVSSMSSIPNPDTDWDTTNCQAMRGLFGQLLSLMASTNKTLCPAYLLVYKTPKLRTLPEDEWWVLVRMARVFPYTCWDPTVFMTNIRRLVNQAVHKLIVGPLTERMQKEAAKEKVVQKKRDPAWYAYVRVMVDVVMWAAGHGQDKASGLTLQMASTLLDLSPSNDLLSNGTVRMTHFIHAVRECLQQVSIGDNVWSPGFTRTVSIALFSYVRHSGCVPPDDRNSVRARIHKASTVKEFVEIYSEIVKPKWTTTDADDHSQKLESVIGGSSSSSSSAFGAAEGMNSQPEMKVAVLPPTLPNILGRIPGSQSAVALAERLPLLTFEDSGLPIELAQLMELVNLDSVRSLRAMLKAMLLSWQSYDSSIDAGFAVISRAS